MIRFKTNLPFLNLKEFFYPVSNIAFTMFCDITVDCRDLYLTSSALCTKRGGWRQNQNFSHDFPFFSAYIIEQKLKHIFFFCGQIQGDIPLTFTLI